MGATWLMLIASLALGYVAGASLHSPRWRPPMALAQVSRAAYAVWLAPPLLVLVVIIAWTFRVR